MGTAEDFMNSFFRANPHARSGALSMGELNELIAEHQKKVNAERLEDFDGMSPNQMTSLLYTPFAPGGLLQFRENIDAHVKGVPFFKLSEILLREIEQVGKLKLTTKGNLPVSICQRLCDQNLIYWSFMKYVKKIREEAVPYLWPLKQYLLDEGIVKKRNNSLSLTKNGEKLLKEQQSVRFIRIFTYLASRFHWGNFYDLEDGGRSGQLGWAYSLTLLSRYGDKALPSKFYSLKAMRAFEKELWEDYQRGLEDRDYHRAYEIRFFECFAHWFGLVNIERKKDTGISYFDELTITKSELFDKLFEVKEF